MSKGSPRHGSIGLVIRDMVFRVSVGFFLGLVVFMRAWPYLTTSWWPVWQCSLMQTDLRLDIELEIPTGWANGGKGSFWDDPVVMNIAAFTGSIRVQVIIALQLGSSIAGCWHSYSKNTMELYTNVHCDSHDTDRASTRFRRLHGLTLHVVL